MTSNRLSGLPASVAALLDDELSELSERTSTWAAENDVRPGSSHQKPEVLAVVASVYALYCAPPTPSPAALEVAAFFIMLFLCIDDADDQDLGRVVSEDASSPGRLGDAFDAWRAGFPELSTCASRLRDHFEDSFVVYLRARKTEAELASRTLSLEEHWRIRRATIFMEPYIDQWMISTGIDPDAFDLDSYTEARQLCIDLVLLANDLGSTGRDDAGGDSPTDLNLVHAYRRENGWSLPEAIDELVALYRRLHGRFDASMAPTGSGASPPARYAALLRGLVDGNLRALQKLSFRYPGVETTLERLSVVRPDSK